MARQQGRKLGKRSENGGKTELTNKEDKGGNEQIMNSEKEPKLPN